jgi:hypothetical protein
MLGKENLNQYRFVHHKSHIACTWIEPGPLWWEARDYPLELLHGQPEI